MAINFDNLQTLLHYQFSDLELARLALTHRSANKLNNERLEFLGDSLLGYVVAEALFETHPLATEGELSRMRSNLVNRSTLAEIARDIELSDFLQVGAGELKSGGKQRDSILADTIEALIAAIYLDGGMQACKTVVRRWTKQKFASHSAEKQQKDCKTLLQELMQAKAMSLPEYRVVEISGQAHQQTFLVACSVALLDESLTGTGSSKRVAEQEAAKKVLDSLGEST